MQKFWYNNVILLFYKDGYEKLLLIIFDFNWFVRCSLIICKAYQSWHLGTTPFAMIGFTTNYVWIFKHTSTPNVTFYDALVSLRPINEFELIISPAFFVLWK